MTGPVPPYRPYPNTAPASWYIPVDPVVIPAVEVTATSYPELVSSIVRDALAKQATEIDRAIRETKLCQRCRAAPIEVVHRSQPVHDFGPQVDPSAGMTVKITEVIRLLCKACSDRLVAAVELL